MSTTELSMRLRTALQLSSEPVAIAFHSEEPTDVPRVTEPLPAGCGYWKHASMGNRFRTSGEDHHGCVVGMHTHAVEMDEKQGSTLKEQLTMMIGLGYLSEGEIPKIPHRAEPFRFATYRPLADAGAAPDVVMLRGSVRQMMVVAEAAQAADLLSGNATMGRPTCAIIPETMRTQRAVPSFGCAGNRVYTELADGELYFGLPGSGLEAIVEKIEVLANANCELDKFHSARV